MGFMLSGSRFSWLVVLLLLSCGSGKSPPAPADALDDPEVPGLAFAKVPAAVNVNSLFEVWVRLNDQRGLRIASDSSTVVTLAVAAPGGGVLHGTLSRPVEDGLAIFDDLSYDRWESIALVASVGPLPIAPEGLSRVGGTFPVRPLLRFTELPPARVPTGHPLEPLSIELVDGQGHRLTGGDPIPISLTSTAANVVISGPAQRTISNGVVVFDDVTFPTAGSVSLIWKSPGLADFIHGVFVHAGAQVTGLWLPGARVGVPYQARLERGGESGALLDVNLIDGSLPRGLHLDQEGEIHGVPSQPALAACEIFDVPETGAPQLWKAHLPVFPAVETPAEPLDGLDRDGPFQVDLLDEPLEVPSRGVTERLRILFPRDAGGGVPAGRLPLVVFHHGAASVDPQHPTLYDRFDHFLRRWASQGFVVVSIDAVDLAWDRGRLVSANLNNLNAMSENQRAAIAHMRLVQQAVDHPLGGHVDIDRVIVAGHSRGGGASIITAATEPSVIGGILIKPLDPVTTVGGEHVWNTSLPKKPFLLLVGGSDADLPYPMVDFLYERRSAPMAAPTILGAGHFSSCDHSCEDEPDIVGPAIAREQDWAVSNAYAVAFLKYVARGELGYAPLLFGSEGLATQLSQQGVLRRSDRAMDALVVDDFQDQSPGRNRLDQPTSDEGLAWSGDESSLLTAARQLPQEYAFYRLFYDRPENQIWAGAHRLTWTTPGATYSSSLGGLDLLGRQSFVFRARTDDAVMDCGQLAVRLVDSAGAAVLLPVSGGGMVGGHSLGPRFSDVVVPLAAVANRVDLSAVDRVELVLSGTGSLLIDDLRFE
jgi:dienelactone hydrolase